jgi:hypothetical protein
MTANESGETTEEDADNIRELAAFAGATLDALRAARGRSTAPAG